MVVPVTGLLMAVVLVIKVAVVAHVRLVKSAPK
jgi:hypothetical protein